MMSQLVAKEQIESPSSEFKFALLIFLRSWGLEIDVLLDAIWLLSSPNKFMFGIVIMQITMDSALGLL
jgi:hypothetical protein